MIQQGDAARGGPHQEDPDLAVVFLAQATVVLPGHADTLIALLAEGALVDDPHDPHRVGTRRGDQLGGEDGLEFGLDILVVPGGDIDKLLQGRDLAGADMQRDGLDALALGADHQPFDVGVSVILSLFLAEQGGESREASTSRPFPVATGAEGC